VLIGAYLFIPVNNLSAGILFNYPRDGHFKLLSAKYDKWYYVDNENWYFKAPDKWQHYIGNYFAAKLLKDKVGIIPTISLLSTASILKEIEDGYREGASIRDLEMNLFGIITGLFQQNLICYYDNEKILLIYYFNHF